MTQRAMEETGMCIYNSMYAHGGPMRTNIVIDDQWMNQALTLSGFKTKKETVEEALRLLISLKNQASIRNFRGKLNWEGDLETTRTAK